MPSQEINKHNKEFYEKPTNSKWPLLLQLSNHVPVSTNVITGAASGEYFVVIAKFKQIIQ